MGQDNFWPAPARALAETSPLSTAHGVVFDAFRLDRRDERLWCGQEVVPLHPKTFAVLCCLVTQAGQLVTKDALLEAVWPETAVSESVIQVAIRQLRHVFGDQARRPRFIETVHGRGYRFIAPVSALASPGERMRRGAPPRFRHPSYFVGRKAALAHLAQWFTTACQGQRQVGFIAGEAGMGKTALIDAFVAQVAAIADVWVGHGQCIDHYGAGEAYLPVLEALGRLGRGPERERLMAVLRQYAPSWVVQLPALVPPAELEALQRTVGPTAPRRMLRELTEALDAFTTEHPLVLVLEDLHWSDRATLAWLASVARRPDPARLLIVGTYRPVEAIVQALPLRALLTELRPHGQCVELALDYLSEADVAAYLGQRFEAPRLAVDLAPVLHRRTTGNPLFLITMVNELVRQQVVTEGPDGWGVQREVETISAIVPATLRALIEQQLAHCSPEAQTLLEAASVAGVECSAAMIAAAVEGADEDVEARCTELAQQGQFLQVHDPVAWPDGTVTTSYHFRHALYQEVLYQRIPAGRLSRWHARIGTRLAHGFGPHAGDMAAALARHFVQGRLPAQAATYLRQAGQQAFQRGAHQDAVAFYEQALQALQSRSPMLDTLAQAFDLRVALHEALFPLGAYPQLFDSLRESERLAEALGDQHRMGWALAEFSVYFRRIGAYDRAVAFAQRAGTLAASLGEGDLRAWSAFRLGQASYFLGQYQCATDAFRTAIVAAPPEPIDVAGEVSYVATHARRWLVYCLAERGELGKGLALGEAEMRRAEADEGRPDGAATYSSHRFAAYGSLGAVYLARGAFLQAIAVLERGLDLCRRWHNVEWFPEFAASLGLAYGLVGRHAEALPLLEQAVEQEASLGGGHASIWLAELSQGYLLAGRLEEARTQAVHALELSRARQERGFQALALRILGEIAVQADPPDAAQAERSYRQALMLAEALGMHPLQAHCHRGLGTLYAMIGRCAEAQPALSTAIDFYRAMDMTFWLPEAEAALAQVEGR